MERSRFLSEHNSLPILCSTKMGWWTISYALSSSISLVYGLLWSLFLPSEHLHKTPTNNTLYGVCMFQVNNTINKMAHSLKLNLEIKGMCLKWCMVKCGEWKTWTQTSTYHNSLWRIKEMMYEMNNSGTFLVSPLYHIVNTRNKYTCLYEIF